MATKLLFIDDSASDRELAKQQMTKSGLRFDFLEAQSGEEGLKKAQKTHPEIVAIDVGLPQMDGYETCKKIKSIKEFKTKVIILTGKFDSVDALKAREMGADDFCVKTSDFKPFWQAVKDLMTD